MEGKQQWREGGWKWGSKREGNDRNIDTGEVDRIALNLFCFCRGIVASVNRARLFPNEIPVYKCVLFWGSELWLTKPKLFMWMEQYQLLSVSLVNQLGRSLRCNGTFYYGAHTHSYIQTCVWAHLHTVGVVSMPLVKLNETNSYKPAQ